MGKIGYNAVKRGKQMTMGRRHPSTGSGQRRRNTEEVVCENCEYSRGLNGLGAAVLICSRKKSAGRKWWAVEAGAGCDNFKRARELVEPELAAALAEGAKLMPLTQGEFTIVDADDFKWLNQYKWHVRKHKNVSYAETQKNGKLIKMHRMLLNAPPHLFVDHRDHNGLNNRRYNLRLCTNQQNLYNCRPRQGGTSRYKGVYRDKRGKKFVARIVADGKRHSLGYFDDEIEAAVAYDLKAIQFFGQFAYLNFPNLMKRYKIVNHLATEGGKRTSNIEHSTSNIE